MTKINLLRPGIELPSLPLFRVSDFFSEDNNHVTISLIGSHFQDRFSGLIERNVMSSNMGFYQLDDDSIGDNVIDKFCLRHKKATKLYHIAHLLSFQPRGGGGPLLTNGKASVFFVEDSAGYSYPVGIYWGKNAGWRIDQLKYAETSDRVIGGQIGIYS